MLQNRMIISLHSFVFSGDNPYLCNPNREEKKMAQRSEQIQMQKMEQRQTLSQRQLLFVRMLELPTEELEERVHAEVVENPALEEAGKGEYDEPLRNKYDEEEEDMDEETGIYEPEIDYDEENPSALNDYSTEDDIPDYLLKEYNASSQEGASAEEIPFAGATSFYETLQNQLGECNLNPHQRQIAEHLIGSLDDDGLLRRETVSIAEELSVKYGISTTQEEVENVLQVIQGFEPTGVGARSLQECLLLQLRCKPQTESVGRAIQVLEKCYEHFTHKRWDRICQRLNLTEEELHEAIDELTRLNPRPGSSLDEPIDKGSQRIIPDFFVRVDDEERITFTLNDGNLPALRVSESFNNLLKRQSDETNPNRESREAALFLRQKIESAQNFIDAITQRQQTLTVTMQAIIDLQRPFFLEGDEELLKPMLLKDVADRAGVDVSTVSRVSNAKYVETNFGIYPLKFFFGDSYRKPAISLNRPKQTDEEQEEQEPVEPPTTTPPATDGEETSLRQIRTFIQECIDKEDKQNPLTDEQLVVVLKEHGYDMARRTVAKYRQQLDIPVARMRKQIVKS